MYGGYGPGNPGGIRGGSDWGSGTQDTRSGRGFGRDTDQWSPSGGRHDQGERGDIDPDYHQWREEQMRRLDDDYQSWRSERYKKFSSEFDQWRSSRAERGTGSSTSRPEGDMSVGSTGTSLGDVKRSDDDPSSASAAAQGQASRGSTSASSLSKSK